MAPVTYHERAGNSRSRAKGQSAGFRAAEEPGAAAAAVQGKTRCICSARLKRRCWGSRYRLEKVQAALRVYEDESTGKG